MTYQLELSKDELIALLNSTKLGLSLIATAVIPEHQPNPAETRAMVSAVCAVSKTSLLSLTDKLTSLADQYVADNLIDSI